MSVKILLRRGTKAQLDTLMGSTPMLNGELGFTTDTKEVFISDGTNAHLVGKVIVDTLANRPAAGVSGRAFFATDNGLTYIDDGSSWQSVSIADLDSVPDGSTYARVRKSELDDGYVKQLRTSAVGDIVTASGIKTHMDDTTIHRSINDSGTSSTDLWSASKIQSTVNDALTGLDFQADVLAEQTDATLDPGASPAQGDRYIISDTSALNTNFGTITGVGNGDIVEYSGSVFVVSYDVSTAGEGALVWNRAQNYFEKWDGSTWSEFGGLSGVTAGDGLTKSGNTINVGEGDGINVTADSVAVKVTDLVGTGLSEDGANNLRVSSQGNGIAGGDGGLLSVRPDGTTGATVAPVTVGTNGVGVSLDNTSIVHTSGTIRVDTVDGGTF
jgi:hypothetical protein